MTSGEGTGGGWSAPAQPDPPTAELALGSQVGGYRIEAVAGRGGMGTVYRVTQLGLERILALKVIAPHFAADPAFRERFRRESTLAASLDHPNVITVYEAGEDNAGRLFVSMRLVDGPDLRRLLNDEGPLAPERAVDLVAQVAAALDAAHAAGLVHRDVKPANVLIENRDGVEHAYLSDFGLVKRLGADAELTGTAGWVGSVDYVAPEQVSGGPVDARTDIYALGALLYTALTGTVPYPRPDTAAKLYAAVNEVIAPIHPRVPGVPSGLDAVIARATAKDPAARFSTAGELAGAARAALTATTPEPGAAAPYPGSPQPVTPARSERRWKRTTLAVATAVALVAGGTAAAVSLSGGGGRSRNVAAHRSPRLAPEGSGTTSTPKAGNGGHAMPERTVTFQIADNSSSGQSAAPYKMGIVGLYRDGPYLRLDLRIACLAEGGCDTEGVFSGPGPFNTTTGISLVDPVARKWYKPVEDPKGDYLVSTIEASSLTSGQDTAAWETFAAPPPSVTVVDIVVPGDGPEIVGVPITTEAGPWQPTANSVPFDRPDTSADTSGINLDVQDLVVDSSSYAELQQGTGDQQTVTLSADVLFAFNQASLSPASQQLLQGVATNIKAQASGQVAIVGYTDNIGDAAYNQGLSQQRAASVVAALQPLVNGAPVTLQPSGDGDADPVAPNRNPDGSDNPAGRATNRRVTITYTMSPKPAATPAAPPPSQPSAPSARTVSYAFGETGRDTGPDTWQVTVNGLRRDGSLVVLDASAICTHSGDPSSGCSASDAFAAHGGDADDGFTLFAGGTGTTYRTASAPGFSGVENNTALSSDFNGGGAEVPQGQSLRIWAYYATPAAGVASLTVQLPNGGPTVANVPIEQ
ncbi:MAG: protein kinase [Actinomycetota bacterium]|nr:protein kinase [Actinomycetota bacterium]